MLSFTKAMRPDLLKITLLLGALLSDSSSPGPGIASSGIFSGATLQELFGKID